jgi:hypothetical protein
VTLRRIEQETDRLVTTARSSPSRAHLRHAPRQAATFHDIVKFGNLLVIA